MREMGQCEYPPRCSEQPNAQQAQPNEPENSVQDVALVAPRIGPAENGLPKSFRFMQHSMFCIRNEVVQIYEHRTGYRRRVIPGDFAQNDADKKMSGGGQVELVN